MDVDLQYMTCGHLRLATTGQAVLENWKVQVHPLLDKYTLLAVVPLYSTTVDLKPNNLSLVFQDVMVAISPLCCK